MNNLERLELINKIAYHLQGTMTFADINAYLGGYGIKPSSPSLNSKRIYAQEQLISASCKSVKNIAQELGLYNFNIENISSKMLTNILNTNKAYQVCKKDFEKALVEADADPASAIGHASSTLESILKSILDIKNISYPNNESLSPLVKKVYPLLNLSPDKHADSDIKRVLGGLSNVAIGLGVLRTKYSTFHGKGVNNLRLGKRHARLAINSLTTVGLFILETYREKIIN